MVGVTSYLLKVLKLEHYNDIMAYVYSIHKICHILNNKNLIISAIEILRVTSLRPTE